LLPSAGAAVFKAAIVEACQDLISNTELLNDLDSEVGDGDCGSTLANGARCMHQIIIFKYNNHTGDQSVSFVLASLAAFQLY